MTTLLIRARLPIFLAACILMAATLVAYYNSLGACFVFDDHGSIIENANFTKLSDLKALFSPAKNTALNSRPIVNLSLAINYHLGGLNPIGYHVFNVLIHIGSALALFGVIRRTLVMRSHSSGSRSNPENRLSPDLLLAFSITLLWAVHPLLTESVTFVIQRTESLMGLFFLLTWYGFVRCIEDSSSKGWFTFTVAMCVLGMGSKEVMATAPVIFLLYDRTFIAGSFAGAWRARKALYLSLCLTWGVLLILVVQGGADRGGAAIVSSKGLIWIYLLTQCKALIIYLKLSIWPYPLVADYGSYLVKGPEDVWWQGGLILLLLGGTAWALVRRPIGGFFGACFFIILAPSSSFIPLITQTIAEHRMYLPLVFVLTGGFLALHRLVGNYAWITSLAIAIPFAALTIVQNGNYRTEQRFWTDIVDKFPENPRAHNNLGNILLAAGKIKEARACFNKTIELDPEYIVAYNNLGNTYKIDGAIDEAIKCYKKSLSLKPDNPEVLHNMADAWVKAGDTEQGVKFFTAALRLKPRQVQTHLALGEIFLLKGQTDKAIQQYQTALAIDPAQPGTYNNLGLAMAVAGRLDEAISYYQASLRINSKEALVHRNLGQAFLAKRKLLEALQELEQALLLQSDLPKVEENIADILLELPADEKTLAAYNRILKLKPESAELHAGLAAHLDELGLSDEAIAHYDIVVKLKPNIGDVRRTYGDMLAKVGRLNDSISQYKIGLSLAPDDAETYDRLGCAQAASGDTEEALKTLEHLVELEPRHPMGQLHFAMALASVGRYREAIVHYEVAISLDPSNADSRVKLGEALIALGRRKDALKQFQSAIELNPQSVSARKHLQQFTE